VTARRIGRFALATMAAMIIVSFLVVFWVTQPMWGGTSETLPIRVSAANLKADVELLSARHAGRDFAHPEILDATASMIESRFAAAGARVESQRYEVDGATYRNVIARFGPREGRPVVVGAHYDTAEGSGGADDNAGSVAGLLELARLFGREAPRVPVELLAFTLEEPPAFRTADMGSAHHAALAASGEMRPLAVVVLEMIGYFDDRAGSQRYPMAWLGVLYPKTGDFIAVVGRLADASLVRAVKAGVRATGIPVRSINAPTWLPGVDFSDHASYWTHDIPAVMVTDTAFYRNPHYHRLGDTPETLDYRRMALVVQGVGTWVRTWR